MSFVGVQLLLLSLPPYLDMIGLDGLKSIKIDLFVSLVVVLGILTIATVLSVLFPGKKTVRKRSKGNFRQ